MSRRSQENRRVIQTVVRPFVESRHNVAAVGRGEARKCGDEGTIGGALRRFPRLLTGCECVARVAELGQDDQIGPGRGLEQTELRMQQKSLEIN